MATCGRILVFVCEVGCGDDSYLWEVKYEGLVISIFRFLGGDSSVYVRVMCVCGWLS